MPCEITIKKNLTDKVDDLTKDGLSKKLSLANQIARGVNQTFGHKVVSFHMDGDFVTREINIPSALVNEYYQHEKKLEEEEIQAKAPELEEPGPGFTEEDEDRYIAPKWSPPIVTKTASKQRTEALNKMKQILDTLDVRVQLLDQIYEKQTQINSLQALTNKSTDSSYKLEMQKQIKELQDQGFDADTEALADVMNRLVQFADGELTDDNFTEETMHFALEIVEQKYPQLFDAMMNKIPFFEIYNQVRDQYTGDKDYQTSEGRPDFYKLKKEAVTKLLADHVLNPAEQHVGPGEADNFLKTIWDKTVGFLKSFFGRISPVERNAFRQVADQLLHNPDFITSGDQATLTSGTYKSRRPKGVKRVLATTGYKMSELNKEFVDIVPEWVKTGIKPSFSTAEDFWKFLEETRKHIKLQDVEVGKDDNGQPIMDSRYFYKGVQLPERTSTVLAQAFGKAKGYTNLDAKTERELLREQKKEKGTAIHKDLQNIFEMFVDPDTGLLRDTPLAQPPLIHTSAEVFEILYNHLESRLLSYDRGTRFSAELPVVNWVDGYAGTMDFVAIMPNMKVDILDWKSNEIFYRSQWLQTDKASLDVSSFDQRYWKEQLKLYKRALEISGVHSRDFRYTRAIPIATDFERIILDNSRPTSDPTNVRYNLRSVDIGDHDVALIPRDKNYLVPVSVETETTNNKKLDGLLRKLWGLRDRLNEARWTEEGIKFSEVERMTNAIRELQTRQTANSVISVFTGSFDRIKNLIDRDLSFLDSLQTDTAYAAKEVEQQVEEYIHELTSAHDLLSICDELPVIVRDMYPDDHLSTVDEAVLAGVQEIEATARGLSSKIEDKIASLANKIAGQYNIADVNEADLEGAGRFGTLSMTFSHLLSREEKSLQLFARLKNAMDLLHSQSIQAQIKEFAGLSLNLKEWSKATGKSREDAFSMLRESDREALISKISPEFTRELGAHKKHMQTFVDSNMALIRSKGITFVDPVLQARLDASYEKETRKWLESNVDMDKFREIYDKRREGYINYLETTTFYEDPVLDESKKKKMLMDWDRRNDILHSFEALRRENSALKADEAKWQTAEYKELLKPENKPVLDMYDTFQKLNYRANENGMMDDLYNVSKFIPLIEASDIGYRLHKSAAWVVKSMRYLKLFVTGNLKDYKGASGQLHSLKAVEDDDEIDPVTNRRIMHIPVYYKHSLGEGAKSEHDLLYVFAKWAQHIVTYEGVREYEQRLNFARTVEGLKKFTVPKSGRYLENQSLPLKMPDIESDLEKFVNSYVYSVSKADSVNKTVVKIVNGLADYTTLRFLGWNIPNFVTNVVGGAIRRKSVTLRHFQGGDLAIAEGLAAGIVTPLTTRRLGDIDNLGAKSHFMIHYFDSVIHDMRDFNDYSKELGFGKKFEGIGRYVHRTSLMWYGVGDNFIQSRIAIGVFMNSTLINGKVVNIPQYVRSLYPDKYKESKADQKKINKEIKDKIAELSKKSLYTYIKENDKGEYYFDTADLATDNARGKTNILRVSNLSKSLSKDTLGNSSLADMNAARLSFWGSRLLQFKNWLPWQTKTVWGKLQHNYEKQDIEVGRARAMLQMAYNGAFLKSVGLIAYNVIPVLPMITRSVGLTNNFDTNKAMANAGQKIYIKEREYLKDRNQVVLFNEAQMIDLYKTSVDGTMRELQMISTFLLIGALLTNLLRRHRPDWYQSVMSRFQFSVWNELTQSYDPASMKYTLEHAIPLISTLASLTQLLIADPFNKVVGTVGSHVAPSGHSRRAFKRQAQAVHYTNDLLDAIPVVRQMNKIAVAHSSRYSKWLGVRSARQRSVL